MFCHVQICAKLKLTILRETHLQQSRAMWKHLVWERRSYSRAIEVSWETCLENLQLLSPLYRCGWLCSQLKVKKDFRFGGKTWDWMGGQRLQQIMGCCEQSSARESNTGHISLQITSECTQSWLITLLSRQSHMQVWFGGGAARALCVNCWLPQN